MLKLLAAALLVSLITMAHSSAADGVVQFARQADRLEIKVDDVAMATYVFRDDKIPRPYFSHLRAPNGLQVTRNHPPVAGVDAADHDTMHPGLWLAFGDLSGGDFWRNKAKVEHVAFVSEPRVDGNSGTFTVRNRYVRGDKTICDELCRVAVFARASGYWIVLDSRFSGPDDFYFGDQEEMGLGVRVATPLTVKNGGALLNSDALRGEKQVFDISADSGPFGLDGPAKALRCGDLATWCSAKCRLLAQAGRASTAVKSARTRLGQRAGAVGQPAMGGSDPRVNGLRRPDACGPWRDVRR